MRVKLDKEDVRKCAAFGHRVVAAYAAGKKEASRALAVPGRASIHDQWKIQADGRLAELAFIRAAGFADDYLDWSDRCDGSYDIKLHHLTIDVKSSTHRRARRLIWPVSKNHFIDTAADILVFVKLRIQPGDEMAAEAELAGWIGRQTFLAKAQTSTGADGLVAETRYMHEKDLSDMADLFHITAIAAAAHGKRQKA